MAPILDSRGHFWWSDHLSSEMIRLPESSAAGQLTIDESGKIFLELDGVLSDGIGAALSPFNSEKRLAHKSIAGLLYDSEYIFLTQLRLVSSHFGPQTVSREKYQAIYCLRGDFCGVRDKKLSTVKSFNIKLTNIDEWLRIPRIKMLSKTIEGAAVRRVFEYTNDEIQFSVANAKLSFKFDVDRDFPESSLFGWGNVSFGQMAILRYESETLLEIEQVRELFVRLQEFLAILMGVYPDLDWPQIIFKDEETETAGTLYFLRNRPNGESPSLTDLWSNFPGIQNNIGTLFDAFIIAREQYGPGVYLYLACLRTESMFPENRFTTLITGLEALYRRDSELPQESTTERERIDRILQNIERESDRTWLARKLENRADLSLEDRLYRLFESLTSYVNHERLRTFSKNCASLRNDITHFGGLRGLSTYHELLDRLRILTPGLATLYHALLLQRIGTHSNVIDTAFRSGPISWTLKRNLINAGLLDEPKSN